MLEFVNMDAGLFSMKRRKGNNRRLRGTGIQDLPKCHGNGYTMYVPEYEFRAGETFGQFIKRPAENKGVPECSQRGKDERHDLPG